MKLEGGICPNCGSDWVFTVFYIDTHGGYDEWYVCDGGRHAEDCEFEDDRHAFLPKNWLNPDRFRDYGLRGKDYGGGYFRDRDDDGRLVLWR